MAQDQVVLALTILTRGFLLEDTVNPRRELADGAALAQALALRRRTDPDRHGIWVVADREVDPQRVTDARSHATQAGFTDIQSCTRVTYADGTPVFPRGLRGRERVPRVRIGNLGVRGSLAREVIRQAILSRVGQLRFCYGQELNARAGLDGRVTVRFVINADGDVESAGTESSTLGNAPVETCMEQAIRRWTFPSPAGGGVVGVDALFVLSAE